MYDRLIDNDPDLSDEIVKAKLKRDIANTLLSPYIDTSLIKSQKDRINLTGNLSNEGGE